MKNRMPMFAGVFMLIAGIFNVAWMVVAFTQILDIKELLRVTVIISPLPYMGLAIGFGGNTVLSSMMAVIFILGIILSVIGGIFALRRMAWVLTIAGAAGALVCIPMLGIIAMILIISSKTSFTTQVK